MYNLKNNNLHKTTQNRAKYNLSDITYDNVVFLWRRRHDTDCVKIKLFHIRKQILTINLERIFRFQLSELRDLEWLLAQSFNQKKN